MYQFLAPKKIDQNETNCQKQSSQTSKSLQAKQMKSTNGLFDDRLHQRLMQGLASDNQSAHPYLCRNSSNSHSVQLISVAQMANGANAYDAGTGEDWHIHYGEHIKYSDMNQTRINFSRRSRKQVRKQLGDNIERYRLENTTRSQHFRECINWINANLN